MTQTTTMVWSLTYLECEVRWALRRITMNKTSDSDGIPVEWWNSILKDDVKCCTQMPANLENSAVATGLQKVSFHCTPKKGNAKECSNYRTVALISHASKVMLKILQARLQRYLNHELPDVQAGFRKGRGTRDQTANIPWIIKKQESSRKTSISALLTMPKPLTVWITANWKILQEMGIPDHLTCLLSKLYAGQ